MWQGHTTRGRQSCGQLAYDVACLQQMGWRHVAQSMAAMCRLEIGLKVMLLAGFNPVTSRQGKALGRATQLVRPHVLLNIYMGLNLFEFEMM
jgi:hypothetical protein